MRQEENDVMFRVLARGAGAVPSGDAAALHEYFNLGSRMADLTAHWAERDPRFRRIHPYFPGPHDTVSSPAFLPKVVERVSSVVELIN